MAPEYLNNGLITHKSDIYSLGVTILDILTGERDRWNVDNVRISLTNFPMIIIFGMCEI